jgi:serine/threonine protein phosphatase PrpC
MPHDDRFALDFAAKDHPGVVRVSHEDKARVVPGLRLALVADGVGGHEDGAIASRIAVEAVHASLEEYGGPGAHLRAMGRRTQVEPRSRVNQQAASMRSEAGKRRLESRSS